MGKQNFYYLLLAPEILKYKKYGIEADIFSLGIIAYLMLYGEEPY